MKYIFISISFFFISSFIIQHSNAQSWDKTYPMNRLVQRSNYITTTSDGGYISGGENFVLKINKKGVQEWNKAFVNVIVNSIFEASDGNLMAIGTAAGYSYITKLSPTGGTIWEATLSDYEYGEFVRGIETSDGSYILTGDATDEVVVNDVVNFITYTILTKIDNAGNILYSNKYSWSGAPSFIKIDDTNVCTIYSSNNYTYFQNGAGLKIQVDASTGDTIATQSFTFDFAYGEETKDGGYISSGTSPGSSSGTTTKINAAGQMQFLTIKEKNINLYTTDIKELPNGDFIFSGYVAKGTIVPVIGRINAYGNVLWWQRIQLNTLNGERAESIAIAPDGGFITLIQNFGQTKNSTRIVKTDSLGKIYNTFISGNVYLDLNNNCIKNIDEHSLSKIRIHVDEMNTDLSLDSNGNYSISLIDTGIYTLRTVYEGNFWKVGCPIGAKQIVHFSKYDSTAKNIDFGMVADKPGPILTVDVASSLGFLRACFHNTHYINYSNYGSQEVANVQVELNLDPKIIPLSASRPYSINGSKITFNIGTLSPGQEGRIILTDSVSCESYPHSAGCIEANIFPDVIVDNSDPSWDKSSIAVSGSCNNGTIDFTIVNHGSSMSGPTQYRIYADNNFVSSDYIQLASGEIKTISIPGDGKTYRLEADQRPNHPGKSFPRQTIEGCNSSSLRTTSFGFVNSVAQDDAAPNKEILCEDVRQSYDPNEKLVYPSGVGPDNYINKNDELEYFITFQNTGSDTAFTVVLKDTISSALDILTLEPGLSSNPYTYKVDLTSNMVEFTFKNIKLPDSTTNEAKSHGFIKYKIQQKADNPLGTKIENKAYIIFDFNAPIVTNTAKVEVNEIKYYKTTGITSSTEQQNIQIEVFPNPIVDKATIRVDQNISDFYFQLFDITGKEVYKKQVDGSSLNFDKGNLKEGFYSYKIINNKGYEGHGKLIIQ